MRECPSCHKKWYMGEKYCPSCNRYIGSIEDVKEEETVTITEIPNIPTPKCPTCQSTNIQRISTTSKMFDIMLVGHFSRAARSQFKCNSCGYMW